MARQIGFNFRRVGFLAVVAGMLCWAGGSVVWGGEGEPAGLEEGSQRADVDEEHRILEQLRELRKEREAISGTAKTGGTSSFAKATDDKPSFAKAPDDKPALPSVAERPEWDELVARIIREDRLREETERRDAVRNPKPDSVSLLGVAPSTFPGNRITLCMGEQDMNAVCAALSEQAGGSIMAYGEAVSVRVAVCAEDMPVDLVLALIARSEGLVWWYEEDRDYSITDEKYYWRYCVPVHYDISVFRLKHIKPSEAQTYARRLVSDRGAAVGIDSSMKVIVNDEPAGVERVRKFLAAIDQESRAAAEPQTGETPATSSKAKRRLVKERLRQLMEEDEAFWGNASDSRPAVPPDPKPKAISPFDPMIRMDGCLFDVGDADAGEVAAGLRDAMEAEGHADLLIVPGDHTVSIGGRLKGVLAARTYLVLRGMKAVPPPEAPGEVTLPGEQMTVEEAIRDLSAQVGCRSLIACGIAEEKVMVPSDWMPLEEVLTLLCAGRDWAWWWDRGVLHIGCPAYRDRERFPGGHPQRVYAPRHIPATALRQAILDGGFLTPDWGSCVASDKASKVIVNDGVEVTNAIADLLAVIDQPAGK